LDAILRTLRFNRGGANGGVGEGRGGGGGGFDRVISQYVLEWRGDPDLENYLKRKGRLCGGSASAPFLIKGDLKAEARRSSPAPEGQQVIR